MPFLNSLNEVRSVNWGQNWTWDVKFDDAPPPFNDWFPAADVGEPVYSLSSYEIPGPIRGYAIPYQSRQLHITMNFYDDEDHSLRLWFREWVVNDILGASKAPSGLGFVSPVESIVKRVTIVKQNSRKDIVDQDSYLVYPEGEMTFNGGSQPQPLIYPVRFVIAGF